MEFMNAFTQKFKQINGRCIGCLYMHQEDKTKDHYFCLKARDNINRLEYDTCIHESYLKCTTSKKCIECLIVENDNAKQWIKYD
jgi:hypothetical protein